MKISLTAWFDETEYRNKYSNLNADDLESVMIEDFCEMIQKQYIGNEPMKNLEFILEREIKMENKITEIDIEAQEKVLDEALNKLCNGDNEDYNAALIEYSNLIYLKGRQDQREREVNES